MLYTLNWQILRTRYNLTQKLHLMSIPVSRKKSEILVSLVSYIGWRRDEPEWQIDEKTLNALRCNDVLGYLITAANQPIVTICP